MIKELDDFIQYCFEHGGFLKNHRDFGDMASSLRTQAISLEISSDPNPVKKEIVSRVLQHELLVHVLPIPSYQALGDDDTTPIPQIALVYRYDRRIGKEEYVYRFVGAKVI